METNGDIVKVLSRSDTIFFIGSGISVNTGLPTWPVLLNNLADYCDSLGHDTRSARQQIETKDFLMAADCLFEDIDQAGLNAFFETQEEFKTSEPSDYHNAILDFPSKCFLTTNYDTLIEKGFFNREQRKIQLVLNKDEAKLNEIRRGRIHEFVYKYHGDINNPSGIILTGNHYRDLKQNHRSVKSNIQTLFLTRTVVMFGFGLNVPDLGLIIEELGAIHEKHSLDVYAFMGNMDAKVREM